MGTQSEIQDYVKRPGRYSNIDGTGEMIFGAMYLGFALLGYLQSTLPKDSIWSTQLARIVFMEVVLLAVWGLSWWGSKAIKKYITYPRTGYVASEDQHVEDISVCWCWRRRLGRSRLRGVLRASA